MLQVLTGRMLPMAWLIEKPHRLSHPLLLLRLLCTALVPKVSELINCQGLDTLYVTSSNTKQLLEWQQEEAREQRQPVAIANSMGFT